MGSGLDTGARLALCALALLAGTAVQLLQPTLWPWLAYGGLGAAALPLVWWGRRRLLPMLLALLALAFAATGWRAQARLDERLPAALEGRDLQLTGVVASLPRADAQSTRFEFDVESAGWSPAGDPAGAPAPPPAVPPKVSLGWYHGEDATVPSLRAGQRWQLTVRLKRPHGPRNPGGFDVEMWMFERGLGAGGYVREGRARLLGEAGSYPVQRLRQRLSDAIAAQVPDPRAAGVLAALVVGDQGAIVRSDWDIFRRTGIAHLVSISGLHVTMFAWLAAGLVGLAWRRSERLMLWRPTALAARWGGLALATAYAVLAGWGVPAQRTLLMLAAVVLLHSVGRRWPLPLVLLAAALAVTVFDPWALLQPGFWLSFGAVALLIASAPPPPAEGLGRWMRLRAALRGGLHTQAVASVGLAPLTLLLFQQLSLVGFVANLVAIPLVTLAITPLALAGALAGAWTAPLWTLAAALVQALVALLAWLSAWPWAVWTAAAAPPWAAAAGLLGGALLVAPLPWRLRALGLPLALPLLFPAPPVPAPGRFEIVAVDVGQGTAVLVRTRGHLLVYDSGPSYGPESDAGARVLLPLLRVRGERRIDLLMLSHRDNDHVGGAASLIEALPVRALSTSLDPQHPLRAAGVPHQGCLAGMAWQWDGVSFEILHPLEPAESRPQARPNTLSCVLRVRDADGRSALLTGDIEAAQEAALVRHLGPALKTDLLLVPHHGSKTSSSELFLDTVAPTLAVVQAGYRSRFGHPAPDILARYEARGVPVLRSDRCGAWRWDGEGRGRCERESGRRYWHHRP